MNRQYHENKGREAYQRGRVIIHGTIAPRFWQRRAFIAGYLAEREAWRAAHPGADEWAEAAKRSADYCRAMIAQPGERQT